MEKKMTQPAARIRPRVQKLLYSPTLASNEQARQARAAGAPILHMGFGQSPFPVHPLIQSALKTHADQNSYLPAAGLPELRQLTRDYFSTAFGFDGSGYSAVIGPGSKELIYALQLVLAGDLLLPVPSWVSYAPQATLLRDQVIRIPTLLSENYHLTAESLDRAILKAIRAGKNPRKLIINYPNNPSGLTLSPARLSELAQVCRRRDILVISDEIYGLVDYSGEHVSIARYYPEGTIVTSGLSKHLSLGGYRLGVALIPEPLQAVCEALVRVASETWSCVSSPIQYAALKAFENDPLLEGYIRTCTRIHALAARYVCEALRTMGIAYPHPGGAFYLYPDFAPFRERLAARGVQTSDQLALDLAQATHITSLPGTSFGDEPANLRLRLATCDYDGQAALDFFTAHPDPSPESLVSACCPHIKLATERLAAYLGG